MKKCAGLSNDISIIKTDLNLTNEKCESIRQTKNSWKFFINAWIIITVLKETLIIIKKVKNKGMKSAFVLACINNASKILNMVD